MALDQAFAKLVQDHIHNVASLTMPTGHRVRYMTANGTAATAGTELATSGGYTSGTGAPTLPWGAATTASPSVAANSSGVSTTNMPATTIVGIESWDGTPRRQEFGALSTNKTTASGDTLSFATSAITSSLS